ncbi:MAG: CheR family methyltransferase [Alphaproteobacteria bacterium]|jgi:chemotaxis protein methyltransferase CheR|nr:protein-glutamate O-methyltransferase CheR [Rickettsiales bacterium]
MTLTLSKNEFDVIADFLRTRSGLALTEDKLYLIETRLQPIVRTHGMKDIPEMIARLQAGTLPAPVITEITEAMTTNESMFYRDTKPFDYLIKVMIPALKEAGRTHIRIWSAACSTGQEPYSIVMSLKEMGAGLGGLTFEILATDLNEKVLERARAGMFTQFEVQRGLPITMLVKYFKQQSGNLWEIQPPVKAPVKFKAMNLLDSYAALGRFDIIFCRNVLIYFDDKGKAEVLGKLAASLSPPGFLMLGAAETILSLSDKYKLMGDHRGLYTLA